MSMFLAGPFFTAGDFSSRRTRRRGLHGTPRVPEHSTHVRANKDRARRLPVDVDSDLCVTLPDTGTKFSAFRAGALSKMEVHREAKPRRDVCTIEWAVSSKSRVLIRST